MKRTVTEWPKKDCKVGGKNNTNLLREEMSAYARKKGKDVRTARHFLRSVGLEISNRGVIINVTEMTK